MAVIGPVTWPRPKASASWSAVPAFATLAVARSRSTSAFSSAQERKPYSWASSA